MDLMNTLRNSGSAPFLVMLVASMTGACDGTLVGSEAATETETTKSAIMYGNKSVEDSILVTDPAEKKLHVYIQDDRQTWACSGVVLTADYVLSARHCFAQNNSDTLSTAAGSIRVFREGKGDGTNFATVDKVILTPAADRVDAALLKLKTPFTSLDKATMAVYGPRSDSSVLNKTVTCYGFGNSKHYVGLTKGDFTTEKYWLPERPYVLFKNNPVPPFIVPGDSGGGCLQAGRLVGIITGVVSSGEYAMEPAWRFAELIRSNDKDAQVPVGGTLYSSRVLVKWDGSPPPQGSVSIACTSSEGGGLNMKVDTDNAGTWYREKCLGTKPATIRCSTGGSAGWRVRSFYQDTDTGAQALPIQSAGQAEYVIASVPELAELRFGCEFEGPNTRVVATGIETLDAMLFVYNYDGNFNSSEVNGQSLSSLPAEERARLLRVGTGINVSSSLSAWVYCGTNGADNRKVANIFTEYSFGGSQAASCGDTGCWAEVPVYYNTVARCNFAPQTWSCSNTWFGTRDGCDCGCGGADPDCGDVGCTTSGCSALGCDYFW